MTRLIHHPGHPLADEKGWVEKNDAYYENLPEFDSCGRPYTKSDKSIHVISDIMDDTKHMANGKYYNSKSEFRKATKAAGCIEVGNDPSITRPKSFIDVDRKQRREQIRQAVRETLSKR